MNYSETNDILSPRDASRYLGLNEQTVRRLAREQAIPAFKVGGVWRFRKTLIERWSEQRAGLSRLEEPAAVTPAPPRILVVDDDRCVGEIVQRNLEGCGYRVDVVQSGAEALKVAAEPLDLVFLDLVMPGMQGPEVLRRLRALQADLAVVILTAYPDSALMTEALLHSPITLLAKPFSREALIKTARQTLAGTRRHPSENVQVAQAVRA